MVSFQKLFKNYNNKNSCSKSNANESMNVVYLICSSYSLRDHKRYGAEIWNKCGYSVLIFDCTWLFKGSKHHKPIEFNLESYCKVISPISISDLINQLRIAQPFLIIDFLNNSILIQILRKYIYRKYKTLRFSQISLFRSQSKSFIKRILKVLSGKIKVRVILRFFLEKITSKFSSYPTYFYAIGCSGIPKNFETTKIIYGHTWDADYHIEKIRSQNKVDILKGIIFIDEDMAFHRDYEFDKIDPPVSSEIYYKEINNFLKKLSCYLKLDVMIAGHPRANKNNKFNFEFNYTQGETYNLITRGNIIVGHTSTALQLAILLNKPIIFVTTDELLLSPYGDYIKSFSQEIDGLLLNSSKNNFEVFNGINVFKINQLKYKKYIENYIKHPLSPEINMWSNIASFVSVSRK